MSNLLYPHLLTDQHEYELAEEFWRQLFQRLVKDSPDRQSWRVWQENRFADGSPIRDGNPIFSIYSADAGRILNVIQTPPQPDERNDLSGWLDIREELEERSRARFDKLTIHCVLRTSTENKLRPLLTAFVVERCPIAEIKSILDSLS